jgi:hypothetical protein
LLLHTGTPAAATAIFRVEGDNPTTPDGAVDDRRQPRRRQQDCRFSALSGMARKINSCTGMIRGQAPEVALTCGYTMERVTRIELALSAWEADVLPLNYTRVPPLTACHTSS